jgi:hypothetical protein
MTARLIGLAATVGLFATVALARAAADPAAKCVAGKNKAATAALGASLECHRKALIAGADVDPACLEATAVRFATAFQKVEARGGCAVTGNGLALALATEICLAEIVAKTPVTVTTTTTLPCLHLTQVGCGAGACAPTAVCNLSIDHATVCGHRSSFRCVTQADCPPGWPCVFADVGRCLEPCP